jgi:hypothetical protein
MGELIFELDEDMAKDLLIKVLATSKIPFLKNLFKHISSFKFKDNKIILDILLFSFNVKIKSYPETISGVYVFEHNIPVKMLKDQEFPEFVEIEDNLILVKIPTNNILKNIHINEFKIENGILRIKLGIID